MRKCVRPLAAMAGIALLAGCSQTQLGSDKGATGVSGSAGPNGAVNASAQLEKCSQPLGIITLVESQDASLSTMMQMLHVTSPVPVIKLIAMQSGCFRVVDRGAAMKTVTQERELTQAGETRSGSNMGGGQLVTPDLAVTVNVLWDGKTGGGGAGVAAAGLIPGGALFGALAGSMSEHSAQSMLTLTDVRTSMDVSIAQGTATTRDFGMFSALGGIGGGVAGIAGIGAYANTPEGKTVAASLVDAYNNMVRAVRGMPPLPSVASAIPVGGNSQHGWVANGNLILRDGPTKNSSAIGRLTPGTSVVPTGRTENGWKEVAYGELVGWVPGRNIRQQ